MPFSNDPGRWSGPEKGVTLMHSVTVNDTASGRTDNPAALIGGTSPAVELDGINPAVPIGGISPNCTRCGSPLRGRYVGATKKRVGAVVLELRRWRCGCGRTRTLRR